MHQQLERILEELDRRYGLDPRFAAQLRPAAAKILHPDTPEEARPGLLTLLAEVCERQAAVRADCDRAIQGMHSFFQDLVRLLRRAHGLPESELDS